jgi:putative sterol carrier protein
LNGLPLLFQRGQAAGLNAIYHFTFTGKEAHKATVVIRNKTLQVNDGHRGQPDFQITADSETWLGFLKQERSLLGSLVRRKLRIRGSPRLLIAFGKCFPS